ncbi:MAG TPA: hypothetical protein DEQ48_03390 [Helicobacter sp.]|nr:hypothetical protein [Helicobacter sp.]
MSNIQESMLIEENLDDVTDIIDELYKLAKQHSINIPQNYMDECIEDIMVFYEQYLKCFNSKFCSIDFYKIASWFCVIMATKIYSFNKAKKLEHNKNWQKLIIIYVQYILGTLEDEGYVLKEPSYREKIMKMVIMEIKGKSDFGIGKNGLYMLVKMASIYSFQK